MNIRAVLFACIAGLAILSCPALPASASPLPAYTVPADPSASTGLHFSSADVGDAIGLLESGKPAEAIQNLNELLKDKAIQKDKTRQAEIRSCLAIVQIRSGQVAAGRSLITGDTQRDTEPKIAGRARIIREVAQVAGKQADPKPRTPKPDPKVEPKVEPKPETQPPANQPNSQPAKDAPKTDPPAPSQADEKASLPLLSGDDWRSAVQSVRTTVHNSIEESQGKLDKALTDSNWSLITTESKLVIKRVADLRAIAIDQAKSNACITAFQKDVVDLIASAKDKLDDLKKREKALREKARTFHNPRGTIDQYEAEANRIRDTHIPACKDAIKTFKTLLSQLDN